MVSPSLLCGSSSFFLSLFARFLISICANYGRSEKRETRGKREGQTTAQFIHSTFVTVLATTWDQRGRERRARLRKSNRGKTIKSKAYGPYSFHTVPSRKDRVIERLDEGRMRSKKRDNDSLTEATWIIASMIRDMQWEVSRMRLIGPKSWPRKNTNTGQEDGWLVG